MTQVEYHNIEKEQEKLQFQPLVNSKMPTVLQILPALVTGGVERGTLDITSAIVNAGGRAIVVSTGGPMTYELKRLGGEHIELPVASKNPFIIWRNAARLVELVDVEKVDIIHARSRAPAWSGWLAANRTGTPFVTTFHGTYGHANPMKHYYNSVMTRGDAVIAISGFIAGHIRQVYGVPTSKISLIPRGIDLSRFNIKTVSKERIVNQAIKWRLPDGIPVIMLPGRLTRWKGQMVLIKAIKQLKHRNFQCLIVGSDQGREYYRQELDNEIAKNGLVDVVHVIDNCDDMPAAYMLTDVVISASTEPEAFGRVAAEAQALGRLVIATDHGGARETVIDGKTGWLAPPGDANALSEIIENVLAQTLEERQKFSERAIQHIRESYSNVSMGNKTIQVYNNLLSSNKTNSIINKEKL